MVVVLEFNVSFGMIIIILNEGLLYRNNNSDIEL